jgi:hypothetical protein
MNSGSGREDGPGRNKGGEGGFWMEGQDHKKDYNKSGDVNLV